MKNNPLPFWQIKSLFEMNRAEWESLCDGCGRCCLQKLKNCKTGKVYYTWVSCYLLDIRSCRCTDYDLRTIMVPDCQVLKPNNIKKFRWLPSTCTYKLLLQGKPLFPWHPLISGDPESVHKACISIRNKAISEEYIHPDDVDYYMIGHSL